MTTCASFKGTFFAFNQRLPTDQEIFDAGVREGIKRAHSHPENNTIAVLRREITELTAKLEAAKLSGFMNLPNLCTGSFERGGFHMMIPKRAFQSDASAAKAPIDSFIVEVHLHANLVRTFDKFHTLDEFYALFGETYLWMPLPVPSLFDNQHIESDARPIPDPDAPGPWIEKIPEYEYELWIEGQYLVGGTHSWEVPQKVYELSAVAIGRGQDGNKVTTKGGDAGDLRWIKTFSVTPGEIIRFEMDIDSTILRSDGTVILRAASGLPNSRPSTPIDLANGIGGGDGGRGGDPQGSPIGGAGGGTGGYSGNGGDGYPYPNLIPEAGSGAAAGGQNYSEGGAFFGFGGGGVGIFGIGGTATSPGGSGSGGETATFVQGGFYGGGGGTRYAPNNNEYYNGAAGVIRLVWGPDRFYPDSNLQDV